MIVDHVLNCKCGAVAHAYKGLEGGVYISAGTSLECPAFKDKDHRFKKQPKAKKTNETKTH